MRRIAGLAALGLAAAWVAAGGSASAAPAVTGAKTVSAIHASPNLKAPVIVTATGLTATDGTQTYADVVCPAHKVVYSGGVFVSSGSLLANINSSWPLSDDGWQADVNNTSGSDTTFNIYALCGARPKNYSVVESPGSDDPVGGYTFAFAFCPDGGMVKVLGGGGFSTSSSTSVNTQETFPAPGKKKLNESFGWGFYENNLSADDATAYAYAVCGNLTGYSIVQGSTVSQSADTQEGSWTTCPSPDSVISGGFSLGLVSGDQGIDDDVNSTYPLNPTEWGNYENDNSTNPIEQVPEAVCADLTT